MKLEPIEIVNGTLSLVFVALTIVLGVKIIAKYFQFKRKEFLLVGIGGILLSEIWWPHTISFLLVLTTGEGLSPEVFFFIGNFLLPITVLIWLKVFTDFSFKKKQKVFLIIIATGGALFEIIFLYLLFTDLSLIGKKTGLIDAEYGLFISGFHFSLLIVVIVVGTIFSIESLKSESPEIKFRGKLFIIAYYSFFIGGTLEILRNSSLILLIISRIILISSGLEFYVGFIFPKWIREKFFHQ